MITVTRKVDATPEQVWAVLSDGWTFPSWVVGASRMRAVSDNWPAPGARLHHSVGIWPAVVNDETVSLECEPPRRLKLQAKGWPAGEATVELRIDADGAGSMLSILEDVTRGPGRFVPPPLRQPAIAARNTETLRRLAYMAERRSHPDDGSGPSAGSRESLRESKVHPDADG